MENKSMAQNQRKESNSISSIGCRYKTDFLYTNCLVFILIHIFFFWLLFNQVTQKSYSNQAEMRLQKNQIKFKKKQHTRVSFSSNVYHIYIEKDRERKRKKQNTRA